jgi:hypothetical protein
MNAKERKEQFLGIMLSEKDFNFSPTEAAEKMGLSHREFSEATGDVMCMCCKRITNDLITSMTEDDIGEPLHNEVVAKYVAHTVCANLAAFHLKLSPAVNFGRVKQLAKKMTKDFKNDMKEIMKRIEKFS